MKRHEINRLSFGKSVAEQETTELQNYFLPTLSYLNATKEYNRKTFYVGHRGSGKSAIFSQLSHYYGEKKNSIILEIKPAEYSYETFKSLKHDFYNVRTAYGIAWELTIYVQIFKRVVEFFDDKKNIKGNRGNIEIIRKYLKSKSYLEAEHIPSYGINVFIDFLKTITTAKSLINIRQSYSEKEFINILNKDNLRTPLKALKQILETYNVYIFIDELDKGWNNTEEARNFINGLFVAVSELEKIRAINVFLSIREDMYNNLSEIFDDTEKIRGNIERIYWPEDYLKQIIDKRLNAVFERENFEIPDSNIQGLNQLIFETGALDYIIAHTLKRPREIIHFCNLALEEFKRQPPDYREDPKITIDIIKRVEDEFSNGRLNDFLEEYKYEYPYLGTLIDFFENGKEHYEMNDFLENLEKAAFVFMEKFPKTIWLENLLDKDTFRLAYMLFKIGFIKLYIDSKQNYLASYEITVRNIENIQKIKINDVFCPALKSC